MFLFALKLFVVSITWLPKLVSVLNCRLGCMRTPNDARCQSEESLFDTRRFKLFVPTPKCLDKL